MPCAASSAAIASSNVARRPSPVTSATSPPASSTASPIASTVRPIACNRSCGNGVVATRRARRSPLRGSRRDAPRAWVRASAAGRRAARPSRRRSGAAGTRGARRPARRYARGCAARRRPAVRSDRGPIGDAHAAGRAARPPAAHRRVRDAEGAARLEHAPAARHAHAPARVRDRDDAVHAALDAVPDLARARTRRPRARSTRAGCRPARARSPTRAASGATSTWIATHSGSSARLATSRPIETKPRPASTGTSSANAKSGSFIRITASWRLNANHTPRQPWSQPGTSSASWRPSLSGREEGVDDPRVDGRQPVGVRCVARRDDVPDQQQRRAEPEQDAHEVERRHAQRAPLVDRQEREPDVRGRGAIQQQRAGQAVPHAHRDGEACLGRVERPQADRVVEEVRGDVGEQDQARAEAQVASREAEAGRRACRGLWPPDRMGEPDRRRLAVEAGVSRRSAVSRAGALGTVASAAGNANAAATSALSIAAPYAGRVGAAAACDTLVIVIVPGPPAGQTDRRADAASDTPGR